MSKFEIVNGCEIEPAVLKDFITQIYSPLKRAFILQHSHWLYRGQENQWIVASNGKMVGYCGIIPVNCLVGGSSNPAFWWVDLFVLPAYRGKGVQSLIDRKMRDTANLKLGFPNALAAKIHRKHGWGVKENGATLMLPLRPGRVKAVQNSRGTRKLILSAMSLALSPVVAVWKWHLKRSRHSIMVQTSSPSAKKLGRMFERLKPQSGVTIYRDASYWQWRYFDAPYRRDLNFYWAGGDLDPFQCVVTRKVNFKGIKAVRILEVMANMSDPSTTRALVLQAIIDAIAWNAAQITTMNFLPQMTSFWRRLGFLINTQARFCWHSTDADLMSAFEADGNWVLGDADNDAPE